MLTKMIGIGKGLFCGWRANISDPITSNKNKEMKRDTIKIIKNIIWKMQFGCQQKYMVGIVKKIIQKRVVQDWNRNIFTMCAQCGTVVPPNSRLIGSKKKRELGNPGNKRLNNSSKPFQPKIWKFGWKIWKWRALSTN